MSMFHKAHARAVKLATSMQHDIDRKNEEIAEIKVKIAEIEATQAETNKFITNLEQFMK